jgi:ribosomal protein S18 acetylase RimI-like enzyme
MTYAIRALTVADADDFRRIRLDALRRHPEAFGSAYEDEVKLDQAQFAGRLATPGVTRYGGFSGTALVGLAGLALREGAKECHKAKLFSMYVEPAHRRGGLAERLIEAVIAGARATGAVELQLSVTVGNAPAQRLYRRMGFSVYGVERRSLKVDGRFYDEELMAFDLG